MNKILVTIKYPKINQEFEMFIPISKTVSKILQLVQKAICEINMDEIPIRTDVALIKCINGEVLPMEKIIKEVDVHQGEELVIM